MVARLRRWLGSLLGLALTAWLVLPNAAPPALAASSPAGARRLVPIDVALAIDNVYGFSSRDKTYSVEGILRVSAPAAEMQRWLSAGLDPVTLVRFQNQVQPWDALLEPISGTIGEGANLRRDYRFHGTFYSDEIDFRGYPFGVLPLRLNLVPDPSFPRAIRSPSAIRLAAQSQGSGVSRRSNMNGYHLTSWRFFTEASGVEMVLLYQPIGWASLVKWLLPLAITMVLMLLTPNLRSSFSSERLAIPPVILLTLVFMQQAYRDSLPSLPYLTVLDGLYAFSYLVTLVFFCEFIWCANRIDRLGERSTPQDDRRIERLETRLQLAGVGGYAVLLIWALSNP